jgi:hypothetical protein
MSFQYKNPTSSTLISGPVSVERTASTGVNFSVNTVGGYMEVFYLSDLDWVIPQDIYDGGGEVNFSGKKKIGYVGFCSRKFNNLSIYNTKL